MLRTNRTWLKGLKNSNINIQKHFNIQTESLSIIFFPGEELCPSVLGVRELSRVWGWVSLGFLPHSEVYLVQLTELQCPSVCGTVASLGFQPTEA